MSNKLDFTQKTMTFNFLSAVQNNCAINLVAIYGLKSCAQLSFFSRYEQILKTRKVSFFLRDDEVLKINSFIWNSLA